MASDLGRNRNDRIFETMLEIAAEESFKRKMDSLPSREELDKEYPISPEFKKKIDGIIAKEERQFKRKRFSRIFMKIAACAGVLLTVSAIALMSVEASRTFILNTIINIHHDHVTFEFVVDEPRENFDGRSLPGGFEYEGSHAFENFTVRSYVNADGQQIIIQQHLGVNLGSAIDNDYRNFTTIYINEREVFLFESIDINEHHVAMWQHGSDVFQVQAYIDVSELLVLVTTIMDR